MRTNSRQSKRFQQFLQNQSTPEETAALFRYFGIPENEALLRKLITEELERDGEPDEMAASPLTRQAFDKIRQAIFQPEENNRHGKTGYRQIAYWGAAAMVLVISGWALFFLLPRGTSRPAGSLSNARPAVITPGKERATLKLADGTVVTLDSAAGAISMVQGGTKISGSGGRQLVYSTDGPDAGATAMLNVISAPRGGKYSLILPDGSKVWLNASSSLQFPARFAGNERRVSLNGEAYFEIAPQAASPFIVEARGMDVTVLGTHFSVNAYADENSAKTTLLEGAVRVERSNNGRTKGIVIKPGEQVEMPYGDSQPLRRYTVDADEAVGWKNNQFIFSGLDVKSIMRQISRWYDVDVVYEKKVFTETFTGIVDRNSSIEEVLKIMETGGIRFKVNGRNIIVM